MQTTRRQCDSLNRATTRSKRCTPIPSRWPTRSTPCRCSPASCPAKTPFISHLCHNPHADYRTLIAITSEGGHMTQEIDTNRSVARIAKGMGLIPFMRHLGMEFVEGAEGYVKTR